MRCAPPPNVSMPPAQVARVVMLFIPLGHFIQRNLDQSVRIGAIVVDFEDLWANPVSTPFRQKRHPEHVVQIAENQSAISGQYQLLSLGRGSIHSHANADNAVRRVPEAHIASIWASLGRPPWHGDDVHLYKEKEKQRNVPSSELAPGPSYALEAAAYDVKANNHGKMEEALWVHLQADHYIHVSALVWEYSQKNYHTKCEGISSRWRNDHDECDSPFKQVGSNWCAKRLRRHPKGCERQHALSKQESVLQSWFKGMIFVTTHLPISRIIRDWPMSTASRFPKALSRTRTLSAVSAPPLPNTVVKKTAAAISSESANSCLGTVQKKSGSCRVV
jgi:hypothetical protein